MRLAPLPFLLFIMGFGMKLYSASILNGILTSIIEPLPSVGMGATMYPSPPLTGCVPPGSIGSRITGSITGAVLFFIITNFGVWSLGSYGYTYNGFIMCYNVKAFT